MTDLHPPHGTVVVTGASGGIGSAVCRRLAECGWDIVLVCHTNEVDAAATARDCEQRGARTAVLAVDLADPLSADHVISAAQSVMAAPLAGFVHCAAHVTFARIPTLSGQRYNDYLRTFDVNTHALLRFVEQCEKHMADNGRIIVLSSLNAVLGLPGSASYAASKAGGEALIRTAAHELGARGITCNTVQLGLVDTPAARSVVDVGVSALYEMQAPVGRLGTPHDVAALVAYLLSADAGWMTGQTIRLDGGFQCR